MTSCILYVYFSVYHLGVMGTLFSNIQHFPCCLECLGLRCVHVCQQKHTGVCLTAAWRLSVLIWLTQGWGYMSQTDVLVAGGQKWGVPSVHEWSLRKFKDAPPPTLQVEFTQTDHVGTKQCIVFPPRTSFNTRHRQTIGRKGGWDSGLKFWV